MTTDAKSALARQQALDEFLDDWQRRHGALSETELNRAAEVLGLDLRPDDPRA